MPVWILCCCFPSDCHSGCSTPMWRPPVHHCLFACLLSCPLLGHTIQPSAAAWLLSTETWIIKMLFQCKPQQNYWNPGALAHSRIVSEGKFEGNSTVRASPSLGVPKTLERTECRVRGPDSSFVQTLRTRALTTSPSIEPNCKVLNWLFVLNFFYSWVQLLLLISFFYFYTKPD